MRTSATWLELREETAQEFNFHTGKTLTLLLNFLPMKKEKEKGAGDNMVSMLMVSVRPGKHQRLNKER
jgi:hypothetical protein